MELSIMLTKDDPMTFIAIMQEYFRGEKQLGIAFAVLGAGLLAAAFWVFRTQSGAFASWLLVPLALMGLGFGGGGAFLAIKTERQVAELTAQFETDPAGFVAA